MKKTLALPLLSLLILSASNGAQKPENSDHASSAFTGHPDIAHKLSHRTPVTFPPDIKAEELAQMRDHLDTLRGILQALADDDSDGAADLAENRLGLSAMNHSQMARAARYMPAYMRKLGFGLHRDASRFAKIVVEDNTTATYRSLAKLVSRCVICHNTFYMK